MIAHAVIPLELYAIALMALLIPAVVVSIWAVLVALRYHFRRGRYQRLIPTVIASCIWSSVWGGLVMALGWRYWPVPFITLLTLTLVFTSALIVWAYQRGGPDPRYCLRCDYDLTGNVTRRCPECGTLRP